MSSTNNVREIRTSLSLDGETAFRKSLKSVDSSLSAMKSELKAVSTSFDVSTDKMAANQKKAEILQKMQEQLKVKTSALSDAVETSTKAYEEAKQKAEKLTKEYGENSNQAKIAWQEVENLGNKMDRMATMSSNAQAKLNDVTGNLRDLKTEIKSAQDPTHKFFEKLQETRGGLDDVKKSSKETDAALKDTADGGFTIMKGAASDLVADGLSAVYDMLKDVTTEIGNADQAYNNFAIKTGVSSSDIKKYSESIMGLYKDGYGDGLNSVADSMATVKQIAGDIPTDTLEEITEYAIALDDAFGYDVAESMRAVNSLADQFGVSYSDAFDLIIQGAQNGVDQNGDLLDTINEYSVQFANLGYSADDMFNMFANGVDSGTWSVDKLGDAVKEFNIRITDGTADEALQALGLGFAEADVNAKELEDAALDVAKAQNNLAKSELTLEKANVASYEAQIAYNEALSEFGADSLEAQKAQIEMEEAYNSVKDAELAVQDAQDGISTAQAAYNAVLGNTTYNLDGIKGKLAAGGESAQEAQQQILTALMSVEDENERYVLGQQLMGTMWEDLGEDAINALFNTQGEISATKDAMQDVIDLKYDDIGSRLEKVGRKAKTEIVEPLVEKYLPKVEKGIEWVSENMDEIILTIENVGTVIVTVFAVKKLYDFGSAATSTINGIKTAFTALNTSNPLGWILLGIGGLATLGIAIYQKCGEWERHLDDVRESYAAVTDEQQEIIDHIDDLSSGWENAKKNADESFISVDKEYGSIENMKNSLMGMINADGTVKDGLSNEAAHLLENINEYTGECYTISDGLILKNDEVVGSYDALSQSLDTVLQKQRASAILAANESKYNEAITGLETAKQDMVDLLAEMSYNESDRAVLQKNIDAMIAASIKSGYSYIDSSGKTILDATTQKKVDELKAQLDGLEQNSATLKESYDEASLLFAEYTATIDNQEKLQLAYDQGDYEQMQEMADYTLNCFITSENGTREALERQLKNVKEEYSNMKTAVGAGSQNIAKADLDEKQEWIRKAEIELDKYNVMHSEKGAQAVENFAAAIESGGDRVASAASLVASMAVENMTLDDIAFALGVNFSSGFADGVASNSIAAEEASKALISRMSNATVSVPQFANGVNDFSGGFAIINENDKGELVNLPNGSQVIPHDISIKYAEEAAQKANVVSNSFGDINVQINNPNMQSSQDVKSTAVQLSDAVISEIARKIYSQKLRYSIAVGR